MRQRILAGIILSLIAAASHAMPISGQGTWETTLQGRLPRTPGGTHYQAYYDTVLNVTWLANANLAATETFGVSGIDHDGHFGLMNLNTAVAWIAAMNSASYLGASDWRLPTVTDTGAPGCVGVAYTGTDCGYNVQTGSVTTTVYSEMASLFYDTLANASFFNADGSPNLACSGSPPYCLYDVGPFSNIQQYYYWSGSAYPPDSSQAWSFEFGSGFQGNVEKIVNAYVFPVRYGDINPNEPPPSTVAEPNTSSLLALGLAAIGWCLRRQAPPGYSLLGSALGVLGWVKRACSARS